MLSSSFWSSMVKDVLGRNSCNKTIVSLVNEVVSGVVVVVIGIELHEYVHYCCSRRHRHRAWSAVGGRIKHAKESSQRQCIGQEYACIDQVLAMITLPLDISQSLSIANVVGIIIQPHHFIDASRLRAFICCHSRKVVVCQCSVTY